METGFSALEAVAAAFLWPGLGWGFILWLLHSWLRRRLLARLENRVGPQLAGPIGLLQQLYDFLKTLFREEIVAEDASPGLAGAALVWAVALAGFPLVLIPWGGRALVSFPGDVLAALAALGLVPCLLYLAAAQTRGVYSLAGGLRLLGLAASAEASFIAATLAAAASGGCMSVAQCPTSAPKGLLSAASWLLAAGAASASLMAVGERGLFSQPEAETEVAGGYLADLSGRQLAYAMLATGLHWVSALYLYLVVVLRMAPHGPPVASTASYLAAGLLLEAAYTLAEALLPRLSLRDAEHLLWSRVAPASLTALLAAIAAGR